MRPVWDVLIGGEKEGGSDAVRSYGLPDRLRMSMHRHSDHLFSWNAFTVVGREWLVKDG